MTMPAPAGKDGPDELPETSGWDPRRPDPAVERRDTGPQSGRDGLAPAVRGQVPGHGSAVPDHGRGQDRAEAANARGPVPGRRGRLAGGRLGRRISSPSWLVLQHGRASGPGLDRIRRPSATGDPHPARRGRTRAGMAANHPDPATLRRLRAENRPRHPRHPALPRRLSMTGWLLESDPAIRWQVLQDLTGAPAADL